MRRKNLAKTMRNQKSSYHKLQKVEVKTDQDQTQPRQEVLQDLQNRNPGPDPGQNPDLEAVRESQDRGQEVVRENQVVQNHDLEVVQEKVALPEVDQVPNLLWPGDQGQNRDQDPGVVPEVPEKVVRVQDLAQEVLEVEVDQNPVNRADQVGPEVRAQIPIEITLRVDKDKDKKRTFCYYTTSTRCLKGILQTSTRCISVHFGIMKRLRRIIQMKRNIVIIYIHH